MNFQIDMVIFFLKTEALRREHVNMNKTSIKRFKIIIRTFNGKKFKYLDKLKK